MNARLRKVLNCHSARGLWDVERISCCTAFDNSLFPLQLSLFPLKQVLPYSDPWRWNPSVQKVIGTGEAWP